VLDTILGATWKTPRGTGYAAEIARVVNDVALFDLMALAANERASAQVRAVASLKLEELRNWAASAAAAEEGERAHLLFATAQIAQFQKNPKGFAAPAPAEPPDGPPIGDEEDDFGFPQPGKSN